MGSSLFLRTLDLKRQEVKNNGRTRIYSGEGLFLLFICSEIKSISKWAGFQPGHRVHKAPHSRRESE